MRNDLIKARKIVKVLFIWMIVLIVFEVGYVFYRLANQIVIPLMDWVEIVFTLAPWIMAYSFANTIADVASTNRVMIEMKNENLKK